MKPRTSYTPPRRLKRYTLLVVTALTLAACSNPDLGLGVGGGPNDDPSGGGGDDPTTITLPEGTNTAELNAHLATLQYSSAEELNVQDIASGGPSERESGEPTTEPITVGNTVTTCVSTPHSLRTNFSEVAILRPTSGVVFPGSLVRANSSLLDGVPEALGVPQGPVTLSVDLPGIGAAGALDIESPTNSSVQASIDDALSWWNQNAGRDGAVNASNTSYQYQTAYSSEQAALDMGLNVAWASGDFAGRLSVDTESEVHTTMAIFKQAFYTVSVDTPSSPAAMISPTAPTDQALAALTAENAPAYVASVVYGRILMVRMETSRDFTAAEAEAALNYAAVGVRVEGEISGEYEEILERSELEVITVGGNAAVQSRLIDPTTLPEVIQGENAIYSASNPGVPIAYTVRNLHDNSLAKLGYTTEYTSTECTTDQVGDSVRVTFIRFQAINDCDGIEGDGDFKFLARVMNKNDAQYGASRVEREMTLGDGAYENVLHEFVFDVERKAGEQFTIVFTGSERDQDILGASWNDDRMDQATGKKVHIYNPATNSWSNTDRQRTGLGGTWPEANQVTVGSGDCTAELHYVIDFL